jgi:hypothetical protein
VKKLFLSLAIVYLLLSCEDSGSNGYYSISITNNSTKNVSYTYNDISDTLAISETKNYSVEAYTQPPINVTDQNGIESVKFDKKDLKYTFTDLVPINLNVANKLPIEVSFRADNFINDNGSPIFTISANTEKTTAKIFTNSPKFTSLVNYPVIIDWNFSGDTVYVVLR